MVLVIFDHNGNKKNDNGSDRGITNGIGFIENGIGCI